MPNKNDNDGMIHQWIYVIIPVSHGNNDYTYPLFTAFCKVCRTYFTEPMLYSSYGSNHMEGILSSSSLPRYGCVPPDDVPVV